MQQDPTQKRCRVCEFMRPGLVWLYRLIQRLYVFVFARPSAQGLNDLILRVVLRGRGYNNCCDPTTTGEEIFIKLLASTQPKLCIDVGAHKGNYTRMLLELTRADVIAFEPLPEPFVALSSLTKRFPTRLEAVNVGVGAREEVLDLHFGKENYELASFSSEVQDLEWVRAVNVDVMQAKVITLDSYFENHLKEKYSELDLLKIDTEGFEYEVLVGARKTIAVLRPKFIQVEYNWHHLLRTHSLLQLAKLQPGYKVFQLLPHGAGLAYRDPRTPEANIYYYANFVFVREDVSIH